MSRHSCGRKKKLKRKHDKKERKELQTVTIIQRIYSLGYGKYKRNIDLFIKLRTNF